MKKSLTFFAILSITASIGTLILKFLAYKLTGSVGFLSDAYESIINLVAALLAYFMLKIAEKPADNDHMYGHSKAEYFSSIVEGGLIVFAAVLIIYTAIQRFIHPIPLQQLSNGMFFSFLASIINLSVGWYLIRVGKKHSSITLTSDGHHLLTDVWTSFGVIMAIGLITITGWEILDPIIAILVAINIIFTGVAIMKQSIFGFMDSAIPNQEYKKIKGILNKYCKKPIQHHDLLTRISGATKFITVHILVPNHWTVKKGHDFVDIIENDIKNQINNVVFLAHIEPVKDKKSYSDITLLD